MNNRRIAKLVEEGSGIVGMVAEVRIKCRLLEQNGSTFETDQQIERMSDDLDTYRIRLNEICEEIERYGTFSKMA